MRAATRSAVSFQLVLGGTTSDGTLAALRRATASGHAHPPLPRTGRGTRWTPRAPRRTRSRWAGMSDAMTGVPQMICYSVLLMIPAYLLYKESQKENVYARNWQPPLVQPHYPAHGRYPGYGNAWQDHQPSGYTGYRYPQGPPPASGYRYPSRRPPGS